MPQQQTLVRMHPDVLAVQAREAALRLAAPAARPVPPPAAPRPADAPTSAPTPEPAGRRWDAPREAIELACGRRVLRLAEGPAGQPPTHHRYQLWEPIRPGGATYVVTRAEGRWGLAHTRRPDQPLTDGDRIEYDLREQRRAMAILRASVPELRLRRQSRRKDRKGVERLVDEGPASATECLFESRGEILLAANPRLCAEMAQTQVGISPEEIEA